jgi:Fe-S-cluster containining protein
MAAVSIAPEQSSLSKCDRCVKSICCTYVTQKIPGPRSKADFDHLLWQVSHENVALYKERAGWYLLFASRCGHLQPDGRCGIYAHRPQVCRDYSNDHCEFDQAAEEGFELYFTDYDSLLDYCRKRFVRWDAV